MGHVLLMPGFWRRLQLQHTKQCWEDRGATPAKAQAVCHVSCMYISYIIHISYINMYHIYIYHKSIIYVSYA